MRKNRKSKLKRAHTRFTKKKLSILMGSPVIAIIIVIAIVGGVSAAVVSYNIISDTQVDSSVDNESKLEMSEVTDPTTEMNDVAMNDNGDGDDFLLNDTKTEDLITKVANEGSGGYAMTPGQIKRYESKEAIEGRMRNLGATSFVISGKPGDYMLHAKFTIDVSLVACKDYPNESDIYKKRDLAGKYLLNDMPPSLKGGSIEFTIIGDTKTPKQTFYSDKGTGWVRWNEDGGSYVECGVSS